MPHFKILLDNENCDTLIFFDFFFDQVTDTEASRSALIEENIKKDYALEDSLRIRMQI